jgi:hypothetical protein
MMPMPVGFQRSGRDELIAFIEKQNEYGRNLSAALADVAYVLMSRAGTEALDSSHNLRIASRIALTDWFCAGPEEQIRQIKAQPPPPKFVGGQNWGMVASVEQLTTLIKRRDELQEQLDKLQDVMEKAAETPDGEVMAQYMRLVAMPVEQEMARLEAQISEVQAALESADPKE